MYVYICICIYTHIHIHTYVHTYIYMQSINKHTCISIHTSELWETQGKGSKTQTERIKQKPTKAKPLD